MTDAEMRIQRALEYAEYGQIDGDHHKLWVIDQMVRALTGCPLVEVPFRDSNGHWHSYTSQGNSSEYGSWISAYEEDGEFEWETGIAP